MILMGCLRLRTKFQEVVLWWRKIVKHENICVLIKNLRNEEVNCKFLSG